MNLEIETKLSVSPDFCVPDLSKRASGLESGPRLGIQTVTSYFDTGRFDLLACGAALRKRRSTSSGGTANDPALWTLKFEAPQRGSGSSCYEFEVRAAVEEIPSDFDLVRRVFGAEDPLVEVGVLAAERSSVQFADGDGRPVIQLDDDIVTVVSGPNRGACFREIEVETLDHRFRAESNQIVEALVRSGAMHSRYASKLEQALADTPHSEALAHVVGRYGPARIAKLSLLANLILSSDLALGQRVEFLADSVFYGLDHSEISFVLWNLLTRGASGDIGPSTGRERPKCLLDEVLIALAVRIRNGVDSIAGAADRAAETEVAGPILELFSACRDSGCAPEFLLELIEKPPGTSGEAVEIVSRWSKRVVGS